MPNSVAPVEPILYRDKWMDITEQLGLKIEPNGTVCTSNGMGINIHTIARKNTSEELLALAAFFIAAYGYKDSRNL